MPISSGALSWPKSYWTKPVEKEVTLPPKRERASITEGIAEKRRRFVKQRSVPVSAYDASASFLTRSKQLTGHALTAVDDDGVWEDEEQVMDIPSSGSTSPVFSWKRQVAVQPICPADEPLESQRSICRSSEDKTKVPKKEDDEKKEEDASKRRQQHRLSITEGRGSVDDDDDDRWRCVGGRGGERATRRFCCWRRGWWCLVVLLTMIALTMIAVIELTLILVAGLRISDESGIEIAPSFSTERNSWPWKDDVFFSPVTAGSCGGGGYDGDHDTGQLCAALYFRKLSASEKSCLSSSNAKNEEQSVSIGL